MLADSHMHLFERGFIPQLGISPVGNDELAMYEALRRAYDIDCALVVAAERPGFGEGNNDYVAALARDHDWMAPAAFIPVATPPDEQRIERLVAQGFVGLAIFALTEEEAEQLATWPPPILRLIAQTFRVVSLNVTAPLHGRIRPAVEALEGCATLFSHLGLPGRHSTVPAYDQVRERLADLLEMASLDHVQVKVSGYQAVSKRPFAYPHPEAFPFVDGLLEAFGPTRLHWGSDFPADMRWVSFAQVANHYLPDGLSETERRAVLGGNLRRVLGRVG